MFDFQTTLKEKPGWIWSFWPLHLLPVNYCSRFRGRMNRFAIGGFSNWWQQEWRLGVSLSKFEKMWGVYQCTWCQPCGRKRTPCWSTRSWTCSSPPPSSSSPSQTCNRCFCDNYYIFSSMNDVFPLGSFGNFVYNFIFSLSFPWVHLCSSYPAEVEEQLLFLQKGKGDKPATPAERKLVFIQEEKTYSSPCSIERSNWKE